MEIMPLATILGVFAYLFGSLSSAIILCRALDLPDPRTTGSNNPGATNVLRIAGKKEAGLVLLCDLLKGTIPVLIAKGLGLPSVATAIIGGLAVLGHMFPAYYRFKGGKGVATALGVFFGMNFMLGIIAVGIWLVVLRLFSYSSLASLAMIIFTPFASVSVLDTINTFIPFCFISMLVIFKHRANIGRLIENEEPKTEFLGTHWFFVKKDAGATDKKKKTKAKK